MYSTHMDFTSEVSSARS